MLCGRASQSALDELRDSHLCVLLRIRRRPKASPGWNALRVVAYIKCLCIQPKCLFLLLYSCGLDSISYFVCYMFHCVSFVRAEAYAQKFAQKYYKFCIYANILVESRDFSI